VGAGAAGGGLIGGNSIGTLVPVAQEVTPVELIEHATKERLSREAAAERLRRLADELSRHNDVSFSRDGRRYTVDVPDEVEFSLEVEIGDDGSEIEVEIEW
jgi:amphi-Trp domain-containing protein